MIDIMEAIEGRHSVRGYTDEPISAEDRETLEAEVARCNADGSLSMRLVWDDPEAFNSTMARYGKFANVKNYLIVAGRESTGLQERCGYYGQRIALLAQQLGLNSCWVALTFKKRAVKKLVGSGEKLVCVVALGHGANSGAVHKSKAWSEVVKGAGEAEAPEWFARGVHAALLAPTAINQQKFVIELVEAESDGLAGVRISATGGAHSDIDLGIVRLHFEIGAGAGAFAWVDGWGE